jgi:hypothetical protein
MEQGGNVIFLGVIIFGVPKGDDRVTFVQRVESLWDMIVSIGDGLNAIANVVLMTGQIEKALGHDPNHDSIGINKRHFEAICDDLEELDVVTSKLNLDSTNHFVRYCKELISRGIVSDDGSLLIGKNEAERIERCLDSIRINFLVQMQSRLVFVMDSSHAQFVTSDIAPFGLEVDDAFPRASEEISEAAKCLAFQRYTAAVFHLMRAMELAVQKLADTLGVTKIEKEWGKLLADIGHAIEAMPKGKVRDTWSSIHSHLYHVKQSWRNDTMHPKTTYTESEAEAVFAAVRTFMVELVPMLGTD